MHYRTLGALHKDHGHVDNAVLIMHGTGGDGTQFLNDRDIHVHMPEGSIGKEGPSAGTALVSAFVSFFTNVIS